MKKRGISVLLAVLVVSAFTACGTKKEETAADVAVTTTSEAATTEATSEEATTVATSEATTEAATGTFKLDFPEGFEVSEEDPSLYVTADYPTDPSNIVLVESQDGGTISAVTEELYKDALEQTFAAQGMEVEITVKEFSTQTVAECDAIRAIIEYTLNGIKITQLQYLVDDGTNAYTVTYTNVNDGPWMDAFEESAKTIRFE